MARKWGKGKGDVGSTTDRGKRNHAPEVQKTHRTD